MDLFLRGGVRSWVGVVVVRVAWWVVAAVACVTAWWVYAESGHEILLDEEAENDHLLRGVGEVISMERVNSSISATQRDTGA
jgi:hypothetical protein